MTEGLRALPTILAICAAVALPVRLRPTGAVTISVEQSCRKLRRDTPHFFRCAAIVSLSPVFMDSLPLAAFAVILNRAPIQRMRSGMATARAHQAPQQSGLLLGIGVRLRWRLSGGLVGNDLVGRAI